MTNAIINHTSAGLASLGKARLMLADAHTLSEVVKIWNLAEAAKTYAKAAQLGHDAEIYAAEVAIRAARRAGEILAKLERAKPKPTGGRVRKSEAKSEYTKTLEETHTSERTAQKWQEVAKVPDKTVEEYIEETRADSNSEISKTGLLKKFNKEIAKNRAPEQTVIEIQKQENRLEGLFADTNYSTNPVRVRYLVGERKPVYLVNMKFESAPEVQRLAELIPKASA